jgi:hypothetical protein
MQSLGRLLKRGSNHVYCAKALAGGKVCPDSFYICLFTNANEFRRRQRVGASVKVRVRCPAAMFGVISHHKPARIILRIVEVSVT